MSEKVTDDKPDCKPEEVVKITNDEKVYVNEAVNKKLTEMSKETKTRKTKRKLKKPEDTDSSTTTVSTLTNNQIYMLLAVAGVIIAAASLYYQRKSAVKDEKPKVEIAQPKEIEHDHGPKPVVVDLSEQPPGLYSF